MPKPKPKPRQKTKAKPETEEEIEGSSVTLLAIMGILGLILIVAGFASLFLVSEIVGLGLIIAGIVVYIAFYITEKRLKIM